MFITYDVSIWQFTTNNIQPSTTFSESSRIFLPSVFFKISLHHAGLLKRRRKRHLPQNELPVGATSIKSANSTKNKRARKASKLKGKGIAFGL